MRRIGIIGSGPMAGYSLRHLIASEAPLAVTIYEAEDTAGCGMPYRAGTNADEMYCNAFSKEIPIYTQRLAPWLKDQPKEFLQDWGLTQDDIDSRSFYPRVLLGEYLTAEFEALCEKGRKLGHKIAVLRGHRVTDIIPGETEISCTGEAKDGPFTMSFDAVIIATGHDWPKHPEIDGVPLVSPWPYTNITSLAPRRIGILGSSLSAIDVLVALGIKHGEFLESNGRTEWYAADGAENLHITMISRNGIMPEPDFFYPYPFEPLRHITPEAVELEVEKGPTDLLQRVFDLLIQELRDGDPNYLERLGPNATSIQDFCAAYVGHRKELGGLRALRTSLKIAAQTFEDRETQQYRYILLHGHENFEPLLDHMNDEDRETFRAHLAPVFADCYAAIPHISVQRVLALYDAGVLELVATREDCEFSAVAEGITVETIDGPQTFDAVIDARGQPSAPLESLPFPTLASLIEPDQTCLRAPYRLRINQVSPGDIYCLAMPQILSSNPFAQGLANCTALSKRAVDDLLLQSKNGPATAKAA